MVLSKATCTVTKRYFKIENPCSFIVTGVFVYKDINQEFVFLLLQATIPFKIFFNQNRILRETITSCKYVAYY
jgi:hypothetical protein